MVDKPPASPPPNPTTRSFHTVSFSDQSKKDPGRAAQGAEADKVRLQHQKELDQDVRGYNSSPEKNSVGIASRVQGSGVSVNAEFHPEELGSQLKSVPKAIASAPGKFISGVKKVLQGQPVEDSQPGQVSVGVGVGGTEQQDAQDRARQIRDSEGAKKQDLSDVKPGLSPKAQQSAAQIVQKMKNDNGVTHKHDDAPLGAPKGGAALHGGKPKTHDGPPAPPH